MSPVRSEEGLALLELATTAVRLWERQDPTAKRKILGYLSLNSVFGEEGLTVNWREPFDQLAEIATEPEDTNGGKLAFSAERLKWLPERRLSRSRCRQEWSAS